MTQSQLPTDTKPLNIVFLDIDGVLNSHQYYERRHKAIKRAGNDWEIWGGHPNNEIDPKAIKVLNELAKDCKFVISSVWRGNKNPTVEETLKAVGFEGEIIGKTGYGCNDCCRGNEIYRWLKDNEELIGCKYYNFKSYVILDDDSDFLLNQASHFFLCDTYTGITSTLVYRIKRFLNLKT